MYKQKRSDSLKIIIYFSLSVYLHSIHLFIHLTYIEVLSSTRDCARRLGYKKDYDKVSLSRREVEESSKEER